MSGAAVRGRYWEPRDRLIRLVAPGIEGGNPELNFTPPFKEDRARDGDVEIQGQDLEAGELDSAAWRLSAFSGWT